MRAHSITLETQQGFKRYLSLNVVRSIISVDYYSILDLYWVRLCFCVKTANRTLLLLLLLLKWLINGESCVLVAVRRWVWWLNVRACRRPLSSDAVPRGASGWAGARRVDSTPAVQPTRPASCCGTSSPPATAPPRRGVDSLALVWPAPARSWPAEPRRRRSPPLLEK